MGKSVRGLVLAAFPITALLLAAPPAAAVDATGRWAVNVTFVFGAIVESEVWTQTGSILTTSSGFSGAIDLVSGAFTLSRPPDPPCGGDTRTGTVAQDGMTLAGTGVLHLPGTPGSCIAGVPATVTGTRCPSGTIEPGEECDDGNATAGDGCDGTCRIEPCYGCAGTPSVCAPAPAGTACDTDDNVCTVGTCDDALGCVETTVSCDDGLQCTEDSCDPVLGCYHRPERPFCRNARSATLQITDASDAARDKLLWRWTRGESTSSTDFADPTTTTDYTFCLFASGGAVAAEATIPANPQRWKASGKGWRYRDREASADGIASIVLAASDDERTKIVVKGRGPALSMAPPPIAVPFTARLFQHGTNLCWDTTFDAGDVQRNEPGKLKAKTASP
jgi:cysteine-rich repeat protein